MFVESRPFFEEMTVVIDKTFIIPVCIKRLCGKFFRTALVGTAVLLISSVSNAYIDHSVILEGLIKGTLSHRSEEGRKVCNSIGNSVGRMMRYILSQRRNELYDESSTFFTFSYLVNVFPEFCFYITLDRKRARNLRECEMEIHFPGDASYIMDGESKMTVGRLMICRYLTTNNEVIE